jgi:putative FmdB family regulatory protein
MPTYEYECKKCGYQFDRFQSITAAPLKTCPKCKGRVHRMLTTGSGIIFKGSGFYETDYKHQHASVETPPAEGKAEEPKAESAKPDASPAKPGKKAKKDG